MSVQAAGPAVRRLWCSMGTRLFVVMVRFRLLWTQAIGLDRMALGAGVAVVRIIFTAIPPVRGLKVRPAEAGLRPARRWRRLQRIAPWGCRGVCSGFRRNGRD